MALHHFRIYNKMQTMHPKINCSWIKISQIILHQIKPLLIYQLCNRIRIQLRQLKSLQTSILLKIEEERPKENMEQMIIYHLIIIMRKHKFKWSLRYLPKTNKICNIIKMNN